MTEIYIIIYECTFPLFHELLQNGSTNCNQTSDILLWVEQLENCGKKIEKCHRKSFTTKISFTVGHTKCLSVLDNKCLSVYSKKSPETNMGSSMAFTASWLGNPKGKLGLRLHTNMVQCSMVRCGATKYYIDKRISVCTYLYQ